MSAELIDPATLAVLLAEGWVENADLHGYRIVHPLHGRVEWARPGWRLVRGEGPWAKTSYHGDIADVLAKLKEVGASA